LQECPSSSFSASRCAFARQLLFLDAIRTLKARHPASLAGMRNRPECWGRAVTPADYLILRLSASDSSRVRGKNCVQRTGMILGQLPAARLVESCCNCSGMDADSPTACALLCWAKDPGFPRKNVGPSALVLHFRGIQISFEDLFDAKRIGLVRGAAPRGASNFSKLEANAEAHFDLPVASGLFLRRAG
jgi:hypothetical protein